MNKEQQKKLIVEIMRDDQKDGLYNNMTAVEWLASKLKDFPHIKHSQRFKELVNEAKEIEKKQIKNSYHSGTIDGFNFRNKSITSIAPDSEQYYNKQYGK